MIFLKQMSVYETLKHLNPSARNEKWGEGEEREGDKYREIFLLALFIVANKSRQPRHIRLLKSLMSIP